LKRIKVQYSKLGKQKAWGLAHSDELIEIDIRLKGRKSLEILLHELCHILAPGDSEEEVVRKSIILTKTLWHEGYRKIDNTEDIPLENGET
jgi:hypothetical protein